MKFNYENYAKPIMTTLARNSPLALAIAVKFIPRRELILIGLVIGPLIELPVLYGVSKLLLAIKKKILEAVNLSPIIPVITSPIKK